jgi:hypothetical protein
LLPQWKTDAQREKKQGDFSDEQLKKNGWIALGFAGSSNLEVYLSLLFIV